MMALPPLHSGPTKIKPRSFSPAPIRTQTTKPEPDAFLEQRLRQQLARDLHDGPVQRVSNATMNLMSLQAQLERDPQNAQAELSDAIQALQLAIAEMRAMMMNLRPIVLESQGLVPALEALVRQISETTRLDAQLENYVIDLRLAPGVETNIYYIVQEAAQNIIKHAGAKHITIRLHWFEDALHVTIRDDGRGFHVENVQDDYAKRQSLGLVNLYERAELIQGQITIDSIPGRGTTVRLRVPLAAN